MTTFTHMPPQSKDDFLDTIPEHMQEFFDELDETDPLDIRMFNLVRDSDVSGVSGTGIVANGVILPSGRVIMAWLTNAASIVTHTSIENVEKIHCHGGASRIVFRDE